MCYTRKQACSITGVFIMSEIVVHIQDRTKIGFLVELLTSFDVVDGVDASHEISSDVVNNDSSDFFSLAGIWYDRDIDIETLRSQGWSRR